MAPLNTELKVLNLLQREKAGCGFKVMCILNANCGLSVSIQTS